MRTRSMWKWLAVSVFLAPTAALAGAGASVTACIYVPTKPLQPWTANVTAGGSGTHCMNNTGSNTTITVSQAGLNCSGVGYVEAKASSTKGDLCATDPSYWPLSYNSDSAYSGALKSQWSGAGSNNSAELINYSKGTVVCNSKALCDSTKATWDHGTQGPLFFIFQPHAQ